MISTAMDLRRAYVQQPVYFDPPMEPTPENKTLFQAFEWYVPADHAHWRRLRSLLPVLKSIGIDAMWLPPGCKAASGKTNGYDIYDLYDLGEFDQKGSIKTKWGSKRELVELVDDANRAGIGVLWDAVLNHKAAADRAERCRAVRVDPKDRRKEISKPEEIQAWVGFDFPGRANKYSSMKYHWNHFSGTDWDDVTRTNDIFKFLGKGKDGWAKDVDHELGNYDYLMFSDLDFSHPEVRQDIYRWSEWIGHELKLSGIRFDAIKHYSEEFLQSLVAHLDRTVGAKWFMVGEYWQDDLKTLSRYLDRFHDRISLFDVTLVNNMSRISLEGEKGDLRKVYSGTLALNRPSNAVTFVMNHDTQPHQSLEARVAPFWPPLGYALILLRRYGTPCVFYGDLFGIKGPSPAPPTCAGKLPHLILARKLYAYGPELDYMDDRHCVGFVRLGTPYRPNGLACVMTNLARYAHRQMYVGKENAGQRWTDILGWAWGEVVIDAKGYGLFPVGPRSVSVWVDRRAHGRERLDNLRFNWDIYGEYSHR